MTPRNKAADIAVVVRLFDAVAARNLSALMRCYHPEVTILECNELPYGGTYRGLREAGQHARNFGAAWSLFWDPTGTAAPAMARAGDGSVMVRFRHQARSVTSGASLDNPEMGVYEVRDGLVVRAQMFHFEPQALTTFLSREAPSATPPQAGHARQDF